MFDFKATAKAEKDFDRIIEYIKDNLSAPRAASNFSDTIIKCYRRIKKNPYIYPVCRDPELREKGYRQAVIKNYILLYKVHENENLVIAYHIFHGKQDYANLI
jgi:addiction module RelE/StbE family toxin